MARTVDPVRRFVDYADANFETGISGFYAPGTSHIGTIAPLPAEMMPQHVGAFYFSTKGKSPDIEFLEGGDVTVSTEMSVTAEAAHLIGSFLKGRSVDYPVDRRRAFLRDFKTQLKIVLHECTHSVGDADLNVFQQEVEDTVRSGLISWKEAITEASTQENLNALIQSIGLDKIDPMLLEVEPRDTGSYVGMVDAAKVFVRGLSQATGVEYKEELRMLVAKGCGKAALEDILTRAFAAKGVHDPEAVTAAGTMVARTLTNLQNVYMRSLAYSDRLGRDGANQVMAQLSARGEQVGAEMIEACNTILNRQAQLRRQGVPSARAIPVTDLDQFIRDRFRNAGPPRRLYPTDPSRGFGWAFGL